MKPASLVTALVCSTLLLTTSADYLDPFGITYIYARNVARDMRTSWRNFHDRHTSRQRHALTKRSHSAPGKCQLRLASPFNTTSPANPSHTTSTPLSTQTSASFSGTGKVASTSTRTTSTSTSSSTSASTTSPSSIFTLEQVHVRFPLIVLYSLNHIVADFLLPAQNGSSFFDEWVFFSNPDPTGGIVNYLDVGDAVS